jgi:hypothetical protein
MAGNAANNSTPMRYMPPGPATDPLVHLYQLFYELVDKVNAMPSGNNNSTH